MKLPSVYANRIDKRIDNNDSFYHNDRVSINPYRLKDYFDKKGYANKLFVELDTSEGKSKERLILCKDDYVININNKKIYFDDIKDFRIIK